MDINRTSKKMAALVERVTIGQKTAVVDPFRQDFEVEIDLGYDRRLGIRIMDGEATVWETHGRPALHERTPEMKFEIDSSGFWRPKSLRLMLVGLTEAIIEVDGRRWIDPFEFSHQLDFADDWADDIDLLLATAARN